MFAFIMSPGQILGLAIEIKLGASSRALYAIGCPFAPGTTANAFTVPLKKLWPKPCPILRRRLRCHQWRQHWERVMLVLRVPRLDMTRNGQRQSQELALKEQVIEYYNIRRYKQGGNSCCVDSNRQPFLQRLITYLRVKPKPRLSTIHLPPQDLYDTQSLLKRSKSPRPVFYINRRND